tara:strand:- start:263 stop:418 length:156 start_codon:yes stop_codon:yes gene_type:complete
MSNMGKLAIEIDDRSPPGSQKSYLPHRLPSFIFLLNEKDKRLTAMREEEEF